MYDMLYALSLGLSTLAIIAVIAEKWIRIVVTWRNREP